MGNFVRLMALSAVIAVGCLLYLVFEIKSCYLVNKISRGKKPIAWAVSVAVVCVTELVLFLTLGLFNAMLVAVYTAAFWLIARLIVFIINKIRHKKFCLNFAGIVAVVTSAVFFGAAFYLAHAVRPTEYTLYSSKAEREYKFVQFSDSHVGALFDGEKFREYVLEMNACSPDAVFITGDFVDDDTTRDDMLEACDALSLFDAPLGVYFVYGNHDRGYYGEVERGWSAEDLFVALEKSGVTVLKDETVVCDVNIIGREDMGAGARKSLGELTAGLDTYKYTIVLDHQPRATAEEAAADVDLVLSGHTHGGQIFPMNLAIALANDITYGHKNINGTDFIVSSGLGNWALAFKTGCYAEYSVIYVNPQI